MKECKKCGHKWLSRVLNPRACPNCKSYGYYEQAKIDKDKANGKPSDKANEKPSDEQFEISGGEK